MKTDNAFGFIDNSLEMLLHRGKEEALHIDSKKLKYLTQFYAEVPEAIRQHEDKKVFSYRENDSIMAQFLVPVPTAGGERNVLLKLVSHISTVYPTETLTNFYWAYGLSVFGSHHWTNCHSLEHALYSGATIDMKTPVIKLFGG